MLILGLYLVAILFALSWVALDKDAVVAFEILKSGIHSAARDRGIYRTLLLQSGLRAALLIPCVIGGIAAATWMLQRNPWDLGLLGSVSLFAAMLTCSLALLAMPRLAAYIHRKRFLYFKAAELTRLVSIVSSKEGICNYLERDLIQEVGEFDGVDGWTAWQPLEETWKEDSLWDGLFREVYLHEGAGSSLIVPVDDGVTFLAWNLPGGSITPGTLMPLWPFRWPVKGVNDLRGRDGWSLVLTELDVEEEAA